MKKVGSFLVMKKHNFKAWHVDFVLRYPLLGDLENGRFGAGVLLWPVLIGLQV